MNARFIDCPEVIGTVTRINKAGDECCDGDRVVGIDVRSFDDNRPALVRLDVRESSGCNFMIEIELPELVAAVSLATLNSQKV